MINAIETLYKGYRFRSRLEARWAVFLDAIEAKWHYELQGYQLPSGPYLPDFFVEYSPAFKQSIADFGEGIFLEVKPTDPSASEQRLVLELAKSTESLCYIVVGVPGSSSIWRCGPGSDRVMSEMAGLDITDERDLLVQIACLFGRVHRLPYGDEFFLPNEKEAVAAARAARFEHGERPH